MNSVVKQMHPVLCKVLSLGNCLRERDVITYGEGRVKVFDLIAAGIVIKNTNGVYKLNPQFKDDVKERSTEQP